MQVDTGELRILDDAEFDTLKKQQLELTQSRKMMQMTPDQLRVTDGMPNRKRRRYMMKQPCDCGSGRQARKCCFKN